MYNHFPYNYPYNNSIMSTFNKKPFSWDNFLNNAQKTLNVINQAMPIYNQVKPMFRNMSTVFKIMGELNSAPTVSTATTTTNTPQFFA